MFGRRKDPHASVYLLADHLDAILAAGEDLLALRLDLSPAQPARSAAEMVRTQAAIHGFLRDARSIELSIAARLHQARVRAKEVARADDRFASLIRLFLAGTASIIDAMADYAAPEAANFDHGHDPVAFLRSRALISEESAGLNNVATIRPREDMMIAGRIELGPLLDLVSAFLDSLDIAYDLYPLRPPAEAKTAPPTATTDNAAAP